MHKSEKRRGWSDLCGIICSVGCAIHCAATPILLVALPSFTTIRWLADPIFHQVVAVICGVIAVLAILPGFRRHRDWRVPALAGTGVFCLMIAAFVLPCHCCSSPGSSLEVSGQTPSVHLMLWRSENAVENELLKDHVDDCAFCASKQNAHSPYASSLVTALQLEQLFGKQVAASIVGFQPWMTPLGGLFLVLAHGLNISLGFCCTHRCKP